MRNFIRFAGLGALVIGGGLCLSPQAQATKVGAQCVIDLVSIDLTAGRNFQINCLDNPLTTVPPGITFLAFPAADNPSGAQIAATILSTTGINCVAQRLQGCVAGVIFDDDPNHNPPGCFATDCRRLDGLTGFLAG